MSQCGHHTVDKTGHSDFTHFSVSERDSNSLHLLSFTVAVRVVDQLQESISQFYTEF